MNARCLLLLGLLLGLGLRAQEPSLVIQTRVVQEPEMGLVKYLDLGFGSQSFVLAPPTDWRIETSPKSGQIRFLARKGNAVITIQFGQGDAADLLAGGEALRQAILPNQSAAMVLDEFEALANDSAGRGMDLGYTLQGQSMRCRGAAVGIKGGWATFTLNCAAEDFSHAQKIVGGLLRSFQKRPLPGST